MSPFCLAYTASEDFSNKSVTDIFNFYSAELFLYSYFVFTSTQLRAILKISVCFET